MKLKRLKRLFRKMTQLIPDKPYICLQYYSRFHRWPNLKDPKTFNEKLQWLKLHNRKPEYITMVDKYAAKKYISDIIGSQYVIPIIGVWKKPEDIDFESLPNEFVLKCNHDSGGLVICKNKSNLNKGEAIEKLSNSLKRNGFWYGREWPYMNVDPKIIAEPYMEDEYGELTDYKFYCFNGEPKTMYISGQRMNSDSPTTYDFFDMEFNHLQLTENGAPNAKVCPQKPDSFEEMKRIARLLSQDIPHLRVDFYYVDKRLYVGELTFFTDSGYLRFDPPEWDLIWGSWIDLSSV